MYDSTCGYNEAVGFYAGTAQVLRSLGSNELFELPLLIQDTAMFFPSRMGLNEDEAFVLCQSIIDKVSDFGGVLVINWHDRSLAPERLWDRFYTELLNEIKSRRVWFGTGSEVIQWFRKRRMVRFSRVESSEGIHKIKLEGVKGSTGPDFCLKVNGYREIAVHKDMELEISIP